MAFKMLRNFGHLIVNLHVDYLFFCTPTKPSLYGCVHLFENYLSEYCSESLRQLSLQNSPSYGVHTPFPFGYTIFNGIQKPLTGIRTLRIVECCFDTHSLLFNRFFPNLQTLKLGENSYMRGSVIRVPTVKHISLFNTVIDFHEEDLVEFFKLNPQIESSLLMLQGSRKDFSSDFETKIKKYSRNTEIKFSASVYYRNHFTFEPFVLFSKKHHPRSKTKIYPSHISDEYMNAMENLYELYQTFVEYNVRW